MDRLLLPSALDRVRRVLVAGAGGGFDVFAGLPLFAALRSAGKEAFLANFSFTNLAATDAEQFSESGHCVTPSTRGADHYFPERVLAGFLRERGLPSDVYAFASAGVVPTLAAYRCLVERLDIDAIVLVDGGTDLLMRGDEAGLGTPAEDMVSLAAVARLDVPTRLAVCVGFGIDAYHGVCHAHFLENVAALVQEEAFLGALALLPSMPEVRSYLDAVAYAEHQLPAVPSIVNASLASAIEGRFGDFHRTERTRASTLFINPLMSLYWAFDLPAVARRSLYLGDLLGTRTLFDVNLVVEAVRHRVDRRSRMPIPH